MGDFGVKKFNFIGIMWIYLILELTMVFSNRPSYLLATFIRLETYKSYRLFL